MTMKPLPLDRIPSFQELLALYPGVTALFFDMDGTLFDTESFHTKAFLKIGSDFNVIAPAAPEVVHKMLVGKADHLVYEVVKTWENFPQDWEASHFVKAKTTNLMTLLEEVAPEVFFYPPMKAILTEARKSGCYLALVTSSEKSITERLLKITNLRDQFDLVLTRDDCPAHKPDPWPYLKAMEISGRRPEECLIFEDSEVGLTAAVKSGAHVAKAIWHPES